MGKDNKHRGNRDSKEVKAEEALQAKANAFDRQHAESTARADKKRENGEYPYDLDPKKK